MSTDNVYLQFSDDDYRYAVQSLFTLFEDLCEGAVAIDTKARIVWINERYINLLALKDTHNIIGRPIEEVIPNSQMRRVIETGRPILLDIMHTDEHSFVVTRIPLRDEQGKLIGAVGFVLYDKLDYLKPLIGKYSALLKDVTRAKQELALHRRAKYTFHQIIGSSVEMLQLKSQAKRAAQQSGNVILMGETGTGKELLAQAIHAASARAQGPFIGVNVAAIPEELLEAEFFGVAPGAYTGADKRGRKGKFELAAGGTLFLDEIGDMPFRLQSKLLRALQEREIEPVGSNKLISIDVRVITATSCDIQSMVDEGSFRADLFFRLNVLPFTAPPLRDRKGDLADLCEALLEQIAIHAGEQPRLLAPSAMRQLRAYHWPGNIRELRNVLERACTLSDTLKLSEAHFKGILPAIEKDRTRLPENGSIRPLNEQVQKLEHQLILEALEATGGKRAPAARLLGISRAKLYDKLKKYKIVPDK